MNQARCKLCGDMILCKNKAEFGVFSITHILQKHHTEEEIQEVIKKLAEYAIKIFEMELEK